MTQTTPAGPKYAVGFAFDSRGHVALIRKNRPSFLAGLWNGIGGHIELNEDPLAAMVREFHEETGVLTRPDQWTHLNPYLSYDAFKLGILAIFVAHTDDVRAIRTTTDEEVRLWSASDALQLGLAPDCEFLLRAILSLEGQLNPKESPHAAC